MSGNKIIPALSVLALLSAGCSKEHAIRQGEGKDFIGKCPSSAKAGETVVFTTASIADGEFSVYLRNGPEVKEIAWDTYSFVMPDNDVEIVIQVHVYPDGS